jgi:glycosyltransferase involved in cell wall biosynthesis
MENLFRIGIISGKMGDVDGVSLEINKWIRIFTELGHQVYTIAGWYKTPMEGVPVEKQFQAEAIRFDSEEQRTYERFAFPHLNRYPAQVSDVNKRDIVESITLGGGRIADELYDIIKECDIDLIIGQNTNAMPMTLLGGMALYRLATEKRMATLFHHHDFWWERSRFSNNNIESLLTRIMPPADLGIEHIVLSSYAAHILRTLKRVHPVIIPNCENFDEAVSIDEYNQDFRRELGFSDDDLLLVQPTRIVRRKRLEDSLELAVRLSSKYPNLGKRLHMVVSLYQGDEHDPGYVEEIRHEAGRRGISLHLISDRISAVRGTDGAGRKLYTNRDVLAHADLVTYLPIWEGFGNALIETIAARVPLIITTYLVYKTDIMGMGLKNIEIRDRYDEHGRLVIEDHILTEIHELLTNQEERRRIVNENFEIARRYFGFETLRAKLNGVISEYADEIKASRKRLKKSKMSYSV